MKANSKILCSSIVVILIMSLSIGMTASADPIYTAQIMQGNTTNEEDALAFHNGLTDSGYYTDSSITECGWEFVDSTNSNMLTNRTTALQFLDSKDYTVAYFTGHGGKDTGYPTLNEYSINSSGIWTTFDVADILNVDASTWLDDSLWQETDDLKVLVLAACHQLDISIMQYYARAMRASDIRAITGYHMAGPGYPTDVYIAEDFFNYASLGNSVKYSWQHANEDNSNTSTWAVLVYKENYNEYYRIPGFPGNTYPTPSATASIYRFRNNVASGEIVSTSRRSLDISSLPLYINAVDYTVKSLKSTMTREAVDTDTDLAADRAETDQLMTSILGKDKPSDLYCLQTPIIRDEVNPNTGQVEGAEVIVEWSYKYFNTYNGVRLVDGFIAFTSDKDGVYATTNKWKTVVISESSKSDVSKMISDTDAQNAIGAAGYKDFSVLKSELIYAPIGNGSYKLTYEFLSTDGMTLWVDAETGKVERR